MIISMKNSSDTIGNQTRHLPACRYKEWLFKVIKYLLTALNINVKLLQNIDLALSPLLYSTLFQGFASF